MDKSKEHFFFKYFEASQKAPLLESSNPSLKSLKSDGQPFNNKISKPNSNEEDSMEKPPEIFLNFKINEEKEKVRHQISILQITFTYNLILGKQESL